MGVSRDCQNLDTTCGLLLYVFKTYLGLSSGRRLFVNISMCAFFTARCTLVQSAVLPSYVVRLSVRPSVCPSVRNVQVP